MLILVRVLGIEPSTETAADGNPIGGHVSVELASSDWPLASRYCTDLDAVDANGIALGTMPVGTVIQIDNDYIW